MRKTNYILKASLVTIYGLILVSLVYLGDFYRGDQTAYQGLLSDAQIEVREEKDSIVFIPIEKKEDLGIVFYPGGKVEAEAYAPLMKAIAEKGVPLIIAKMPFDLAVLNPDKAEQLMDDYENLGVEHWYVGGHSLGGAMASDFAVEHPQRVEGVVLLGSYPNKSQEGMPFSCITIVGSEDGILNWDAFRGTEFSKQSETVIIEGGNHSYFGNYGLQAGDNKGTIAREEQQKITSDAIVLFIKKGAN